MTQHRLLEGKVEDLEAKFPTVDVVALAAGDPTPSKKYLEWMTKQVARGATIEDVVPTIEFFHRNVQRLEKRDVNQYRTLRELEDAVKELGVSKRQERIQDRSGGELVWSDGNVSAYRIDTKNASCLYGSGTKWCVTMKDAGYFEEYTMSNVVFYYVIKRDLKFALAYQRDAKNNVLALEIFDSGDRMIKQGAMASRLGINVRELVRVTRADARARPKAFIARLSDNEVSAEEFDLAWPLMRDLVIDNEQLLDVFVDRGPVASLEKLRDDPNERVRVRVGLKLDRDKTIFDGLMSGKRGRDDYRFDPTNLSESFLRQHAAELFDVLEDVPAQRAYVLRRLSDEALIERLEPVLLLTQIYFGDVLERVNELADVELRERLVGQIIADVSLNTLRRAPSVNPYALRARIARRLLDEGETNLALTIMVNAPIEEKEKFLDDVMERVEGASETHTLWRFIEQAYHPLRAEPEGVVNATLPLAAVQRSAVASGNRDAISTVAMFSLKQKDFQFVIDHGDIFEALVAAILSRDNVETRDVLLRAAAAEDPVVSRAAPAEKTGVVRLQRPDAPESLGVRPPHGGGPSSNASEIFLRMKYGMRL